MTEFKEKINEVLKSMNYSFDDLESIKITKEMVEEKNDNSFDFLKYLQKRKF